MELKSLTYANTYIPRMLLIVLNGIEISLTSLNITFVLSFNRTKWN